VPVEPSRASAAVDGSIVFAVENARPARHRRDLTAVSIRLTSPGPVPAGQRTRLQVVPVGSYSASDADMCAKNFLSRGPMR
jgi:hypothetical protein